MQKLEQSYQISLDHLYLKSLNNMIPHHYRSDPLLQRSTRLTKRIISLSVTFFIKENLYYKCNFSRQVDVNIQHQEAIFHA